MSFGVSRSGNSAIKPMATDSAMELCRRTRLLRHSGVRTPDVSFDPAASAVVMPWIAGTQGRDVGGKPGLLEDFVKDAARCAARLHMASPDGLRLPRHDPWRRISPRLSGPALSGTEFQRRVGRLHEALIAAQPAAPRHPVPVHGDFHIGQMVQDRSGSMWILDLDDLALGAPEADLGNFTAHLVTGPLHRDFASTSLFMKWSEFIQRSWESESEIPANATELRWYGTAAFLRRALKLAETGRDNRAALALESAEGVFLQME